MASERGMAENAVLGFIGLGSMGSAMAPRLVAAGHRVVAFDTAAAPLEAFRAAGGQTARTIGDIAREADIVFLSLPTPKVVRDVALSDDLAGGRVRLMIDL